MPKQQVQDPKAGDAQAPTAKADPQHPEVHPERHAADGAQELTTLPGAAQNAGGDLSGGGPAGGAGAMQAVVDPNPGIGTTHPAAPPSGPGVNRVPDDADTIYTYEQALALPLVEDGSPVEAPSDEELQRRNDEEHEKRVKQARDRAPEGEDVPEVDRLPIRRPITAFMDADRRFMRIVKTKDGTLGAMPDESIKDRMAPNAATPTA